MPINKIFDFIVQDAEHAQILKNQKLLGGVTKGFIDINSLNPVRVHLLAVNHSLSIGLLLNLADTLSEIVEAQALKYLQNYASPETAKEFYDFMQLITRVQKEGVEVIWKHIENAIANLLFPTFVSMYSEDECACMSSPWRALPYFEEAEIVADFTKLEAKAKALEKQAYASYREQIKTGCQATLEDLSELQAQVQGSRGRDEYFMRAIHPSRPKTVFFDMAAEALYDHRHSSREAQQAFDRRFGLVVATNQ